MTAAEADELRQLLADYLPVKDTLPWKVSQALNLSEDAARMQLFQRALLLLATALEGLIQSDANRVAKQFRERLPELAHEVGVAGVDEQFARDLYAARSEAAHGAQVSMFHVEPTPEEAMADEGPEQPHGEPEPPEAANDIAAPLALAQDLVRVATVGRFRMQRLGRSSSRRRQSLRNGLCRSDQRSRCTRGTTFQVNALAAPVHARFPEAVRIAWTRFSGSDAACEDGVFDLKAP